MNSGFVNKIFSIKSNDEFSSVALDTFNYQFENNITYRKYVQSLGIEKKSVKDINKIPFLPIDFFKKHKVYSSKREHKIIFESSGTTGQISSRHYIADNSIYEQSFTKGFEEFYGNISDYTILALLPSYLDKGNSSLVFMVEKLINLSKNKKSGFFLYNHKELVSILNDCEKTKQKYILIGVSYALLDLIENFTLSLPNAIIMETGGMKGRRKELTKTELHEVLKKGFNTKDIQSEYGMTELLSQAYSMGDRLYRFPNWAKVVIRDLYDPFCYNETKSGGINIIDLANIYSCSFIETQDIGKRHDNNQFEVLGRIDNTEIRGCNLMISE